MSPTSRIYWWTLPLIVTGCVLVAVLDLRNASGKSQFEFLAVGFAIGTLFGQTTMAAHWTAFGPTPLYRRLLLSLVWLTLLLAAFSICTGLGTETLAIMPIMAVCLGLQWILVQVPLWLLAFVYGLRLQYQAGGQADARQPQFGLGQLMIFTLIVATILGISRLIVTSGILSVFRGPELPIMLFLAAAAVLISLPLSLAALLPRLAWLGVLLVLALAALATVWEQPIVQVAFQGGPNTMHLVWINAFTSIWVLAFVVAARCSGYRLTSCRRSVREN